MNAIHQPKVLITGVSSGIGLALSEFLLKSGAYHVIGTVRKPTDGAYLQETFPKHFSLIIMDVGSTNSVKESFSEVAQICGEDGLYALVNNAGISVPGPLKEMPVSDFEKQMDINVNSIIRVTNTFLPLLGANLNSKYTPGRIINVSSVSGLFLTPFLGAYCISKHAVENISDIYRMELSPYNIKVVSIQPGPIKTKIWKKALNFKDRYHDTDYGKLWKSLPKRTQKAEQNALPADVLSHKVFRILSMKNPGKRYIIDKNKFSRWFAAYALPASIPQTIIARYLKKAIRNS